MRVYPGVHWSLSFRVNVCTLYQYLLRPVTVCLYLVKYVSRGACYATPHHASMPCATPCVVYRSMARRRAVYDMCTCVCVAQILYLDVDDVT